jgi:hypothetical protein
MCQDPERLPRRDTAVRPANCTPQHLIRDNLNTHISAAMRTFISSRPDRLTVVRLSAYAPDLNPVEGVWANMPAAQLSAVVPGLPSREQAGIGLTGAGWRQKFGAWWKSW